MSAHRALPLSRAHWVEPRPAPDPLARRNAAVDALLAAAILGAAACAGLAAAGADEAAGRVTLGGASALLLAHAACAARGSLRRPCRSLARQHALLAVSAAAVVWGGVAAHYAAASGAPLDALAVALLLAVAAPALAVGAYRGLTSLTPDNEDAAILVCLRCSCLSLAAKRACCALPFAALAGYSAAVAAANWATTCGQPLHQFLLGAAALFGALALHVLLVFFGGRRRPGARALLAATAAGAVAGLAWAVAGSVWLARGADECRQEAPHLFAAAVVLKVLLMAVSGTVLAVSLCCKVERFLEVVREGEFVSVAGLQSARSSQSVEMTGVGVSQQADGRERAAV